MTKKEISAILSRANGDEVGNIASLLSDQYHIEILKEPQKTLVMVKVRESIGRSLFYLGEILATECMVKVDGKKGCSVMAGDDFEKVLSAAIIDAALNAQVTESGEIMQEIEKLQILQEAVRAKRNREIRKSKVNFNVMGE